MVVNLMIVMLTEMLKRHMWVPRRDHSNKDITITEIVLRIKYIDIKLVYLCGKLRSIEVQMILH